MKKVISYIKNSHLIRSFRELDKRLFLIMVSELLLIISLFIVFLGASAFLNSALKTIGFSNDELTKLDINNENSAISVIQEKMKSVPPEQFQNFLRASIFNILISLVVISLIISFFKSLEWSWIEGKKWSRSFYIKYIGLFITWNVSWILFFLIIALGFHSSLINYSIWVWFFLFTYFSLLVYPIFVREKNTMPAIKKTFRQGIKKFHKLILSFINMWLLLQIGLLIIILSAKIPPLAAVILILYLLFYLAWIKVYMFLVTSKC